MILDTIEQDVLKKLVDDSQLMEVVKKVLLADVYYKGTLRKDMKPDPMRNAAFALAIQHPEFSDEQLGRDLRAQAEGAKFVETAFTRLLKFKTPEKPPAPSRRSGR